MSATKSSQGLLVAQELEALKQQKLANKGRSKLKDLSTYRSIDRSIVAVAVAAVSVEAVLAHPEAFCPV